MKELLYKALSLGRNKKTAKEEYLVSTGEKEPASFAVREKEILLADVFKDRSLSLHLIFEKEGYIEIYVSCTEGFIQTAQRVITTDDGEGAQAQVSFTISAKALHNGKNFGEIVFKSVRQEIRIPVIIDNRIALKMETAVFGPDKITRLYLDFRMGRITRPAWQAEMEKGLCNVSGNTPRDLFCMLCRAHAFVISEEGDDPENIIGYVSAQLEERTDYSAELFAYFLYVKSLCEKNEELTKAACASVRRLYEDAPSWQLLWICFYMDESYADNPSKKISEIRQLFLQGKCKSPVMYFEAWEVLRENPGLVSEAGILFSLQILNFAVKNSLPETGPAVELSRLLYETGNEGLSEINTGLAIRVLKDAFDKYPVSALSNTISKLLIFNKNRDSENHIFFERAVFDFADIPGLYNYYFYTGSDEEMPRIPERLLRYFSGNQAALFENRAYFYANVIKNRYESYAYKTAYESCEKQITAFAYDNAVRGNNSALLAVIYNHVLENAGGDTELKRAVFRVSFIKKITCRNPDMAGVLVFHKELSSYAEVPLENNEALAGFFSPYYLVLFRDKTGNVYKNIEYEITGFEDEKKYTELCIKDLPLAPFMLMGDCLEAVKEKKAPLEVVSFLLEELKKGDFTKEYGQKLVTGLLEFYCGFPADREVYEKLTEFLKEDISPRSRGLLTGLMIENRDYDRAAAEIKKNGSDYVDPALLLKLTHILVQLSGDEDREFILKLCGRCLEKNFTDTDILRYMCRWCEGPLDLLALLYAKSSEKNVYNLKTAERILERCVYENARPENAADIFARCYKDSSRRELINYFLEYCAEKYLSGRPEGAGIFFEYLEKDLERGLDFSDAAKAAYLLYMKDKKDISSGRLKLTGGLLKELTAKGIMLEEFKAYRKMLAIPPLLANTYIVSVNSDTSKPPRINYKITSDRGCVEKHSKMDMILPGIWVKYFTPVFGDTLTWSIEEGKSTSVSFSDMEPVPDSSRFFAVNEIIRLGFSENDEACKAALKRYYIKNELISRLF